MKFTVVARGATTDQIIRGLASPDCSYCAGSGIEEGEEYPLSGFGREICYMRGNDRPCRCIPKVDFEGSPVSLIVQVGPPLVYTTAHAPIGIQIEVIER